MTMLELLQSVMASPPPTSSESCDQAIASTLIKISSPKWSSKKLRPRLERKVRELREERYLPQLATVIGTEYKFYGEAAIIYSYFLENYEVTDYRINYNRAFCFYELDLFELALYEIETAIKACRDCIPAHIKKGRILTSLNRFDEAEDSFNCIKLIDLRYDDPNLDDAMKWNIYHGLRHLGYDKERAGYAKDKYYSYREAKDHLKNGGFEMHLEFIKYSKKELFSKLRYDKSVLTPATFCK